MIRNGQVYGRPLVDYRDTQSNIEALTGLVGGESAYATDTGKTGYYNAILAEWVWEATGGGGSGGAFQRVLSSDLTLADGECLVVAGYIDDNGYDITMNGDAELEIL